MGYITHQFTAKNLHDEGTHQLAIYDWDSPRAKRVCVCVHGLTRNARDFDILAEALVALDYRVIAISMPGRGESPNLANPMAYNYATYVADCVAVLDNFHLRKIDWVGTSMGGIIGMMVAAFHDDRIRKLVLNDVGAFLSKESLSRIFAYVNALPEKFATRAEAEDYVRINFAPWGITDEAQWQRLIDTSIAQNTDGSWRYLCDPKIAEPLKVTSENFTKVEDINLAEVWEKVKIQTYIIRGETSDVLLPETVSAMRSSNIRAESVTIAGVGHAPALMSPEQVELVTRWLTRDATATIAALGI